MLTYSPFVPLAPNQSSILYPSQMLTCPAGDLPSLHPITLAAASREEIIKHVSLYSGSILYHPSAEMLHILCSIVLSRKLYIMKDFENPTLDSG